MRVVGLTGSVACGKTEVLKCFRRCGASVLSADDLVHRILGSNEVKRSIKKRYGLEVFARGNIHRKRLRGLISKEPDGLKFLEHLMHPQVKKSLRKKMGQVKRKRGILVLEVPLLIETGFHRFVDSVVVVTAPQSRRQSFAMAKGMNKTEYAVFTKRQFSQSKKVNFADYVIRNNGNINQLKKRATDLYKRILKKEIETHGSESR
jgi:dephospho-CoA kinase